MSGSGGRGIPAGGRAGAGAYLGELTGSGAYVWYVPGSVEGASTVRTYCIILVDVAPACRWSLLTTGTVFRYE